MPYGLEDDIRGLMKDLQGAIRDIKKLTKIALEAGGDKEKIEKISKKWKKK